MTTDENVKAAWSSAYITALPDSAFACIDKSGRHYPHHSADGKVDLPHLRNALSRIDDPGATQCGKAHLEAHAREAGIGKAAEPIKAELVGKNKWRVNAIPFGGPFDGKDFDGEFFSKRTDIKPDWFDRRPLVWNHNLDEDMKADPVMGTVDDLELEEDGWWVTAWLDRSHRYWQHVNTLLGKGLIYGSSGTLGTFARTDHKTGEILVWPYIEQTFTPTPSNIFSVVKPMKAVDHFDGAKIGLTPALRGILTDLDSPEADLPPDLPAPGGDVEAMQRRRLEALVQYELTRIKTI